MAVKVSTSEAALQLGISVQGVHYRIKNNKLKSIKENGKVYVFLDQYNNNIKKTTTSVNIPNNTDELLKAKDEQIELLKEFISSIKKQYKKEINRLETNQNKIIEVFKSEILLLQQAYNEMKNLYQIEHKNSSNIMTIYEFFAFMKKHNKTNTQIKSIILDRIKANDNRFIYNTKTKELTIYKSDFVDLL